MLNYDLLKSYLVHVMSSKGIPLLGDHKARSNVSIDRLYYHVFEVLQLDCCAGSIYAHILHLQFAPPRADEAGWQVGGEGACLQP